MSDMSDSMKAARENMDQAFRDDPDLRDMFDSADLETQLDILDLFLPETQALFVRVRNMYMSAKGSIN